MRNRGFWRICKGWLEHVCSWCSVFLPAQLLWLAQSLCPGAMAVWLYSLKTKPEHRANSTKLLLLRPSVGMRTEQYCVKQTSHICCLRVTDRQQNSLWRWETVATLILQIWILCSLGHKNQTDDPLRDIEVQGGFPGRQWSRICLPVQGTLGLIGDRRLGFNPWVRKIAWRRKWQPTPVFSPGEFHGGTWWATVHGFTKSWTQVSTHTHEVQGGYLGVSWGWWKRTLEGQVDSDLLDNLETGGFPFILEK